MMIKTKEKKNIPTVVCTNIECQTMLAYWLHLIRYYVLEDESILGRLKKRRAVIKTSEKTIENFGLILKWLRVPSTEVCSISNFNSKEYSFDIEFLESANKGKLYLRFGDGFDYCDEITIDLNGQKKTFICIFEDRDKPNRIIKNQSTWIDNSTGNECHQFYSKYRVCFVTKIGQETLNIEIVKPGNCQDEIMKCENEEEFVKYLLGLSLPIEIDEIYGRMRDILGLDSTVCPSVTMESKLDRTRITNSLRMEYGCLKKLVITKNGITIHVHEDGTWKSYPSKHEEDNNRLIAKTDDSSSDTIEKVLKFKQMITQNLKD